MGGRSETHDRRSKLEDTRLSGIAEALRRVGIAAGGCSVCVTEFVDEVRDQLLRLDGVLVWVDPIVKGPRPDLLDALLRNVADAGVLVSAHPA